MIAHEHRFDLDGVLIETIEHEVPDEDAPADEPVA